MSKSSYTPQISALLPKEYWAVTSLFKAAQTNNEVKHILEIYLEKKENLFKLVKLSFDSIVDTLLIIPKLQFAALDSNKITFHEIKYNERITRIDIIFKKNNSSNEIIAMLDHKDFEKIIDKSFYLFNLALLNGVDLIGSSMLRDHLTRAKKTWDGLREILNHASRGDDDFEKLTYLLIGAACENLQ